jgi:NarL family two-component system response regulator LiaR
MSKKTQVARTKVVIVEDDTGARALLEDTLREAKEFTCVACFKNGTEALANMPKIDPDIVLLEADLPILNGLECAKRLRINLPCLKIVMISAKHDKKEIEKSIKAGVCGYLIKPVSRGQCLATLKCALGKLNKTNRKTPKFENEIVNCSLLTGRENEVMSFLADGLIYKEIADKLQISYSAVHKYQHNIFVKFRVSNRSEAIRVWLKHCDNRQLLLTSETVTRG